jgi:RecB family exonuclease
MPCAFRQYKYAQGNAAMPDKNDRAELEMQILKAKELAETADAKTKPRLEALASALEQQLRETDE